MAKDLAVAPSERVPVIRPDYLDDLKRAERLLAGEKRLLEMVALGRPLAEILNSISTFVEQMAPECMCAIFLIDPAEHKFDKGFAPTLGDAYTGPLYGVPVVPGSAPCGAAAVLKTQAIAVDIESDPRWMGSPYQDHALAFGLRAVWSTPIVSRSGEVLGTFAVYQRHPGSPTQIQQDLIAQFTHIASIAIERARSDNAIRRSEAFLAEGQRISSTGTFYWRRTTDEIICSAETYRIFGIEPGTPVTLQLIASRIHPDDSQRFKIRSEVRRTDNSGSGEAEYRLLLPDGSIKFTRVVSQVTTTESGEVEYTGVIQDVTEARVAEETLSKLRSELTHVSRVTTLGALTASIAHEVNQPLAGIVTNASTCLRMLAADPPNVEGARETARRTIRDGERASEVIARLRALFTKKTITTGSIDLNEATREVVALSMSELQRQRVAVRLELADDLPPVKGDRVQLQQVILNLLLNASDAMSTVDRPRELVIGTSSDGADVHLSVRDTGIGFDADDPDKLFDAFYTTKSSGMGIGLSVSRSIMERHSGRLLATRNRGPGATFSFSIPCEPQDVLGAPGPMDRHQGMMVG